MFLGRLLCYCSFKFNTLPIELMTHVMPVGVHWYKVVAVCFYHMRTSQTHFTHTSHTFQTHSTHTTHTLHTHTLHTEISRKRYTSCTSFKNCSTDRRTWIHQFKQSVYVLSLVKLFVYVLYSRLVKNMTLHLHIFSFIRWDVLPPTCFNWLSVFYY